jgi:predicted nucleic acid binding AN1-type Zn finger protein
MSTKNKCHYCKISVGIMYFKCKCDDTKMFCIKHRYPDFHDCSINALAKSQEKLRKENPIIESTKINKI